MKKFSFVFIYLVMMAFPSLILLFFTHDLIDMHALLVLVVISLFVGGILEIISVKQGKKDKFFIWEYSTRTTLGKKIFGVAVEDMVLFLILTPIFVVSAWEALKKVMDTYQYPMWLTLFGGLTLILVTYYLVYRLTKPK